MHRAGVDNFVWLTKSRITIERHSAFRTTARRIALHAFAHRAKIFVHRLALRCCYRCLRRRMIMWVAAGIICEPVWRRQFHRCPNIVPSTTFGRIKSKRNAACLLQNSAVASRSLRVPCRTLHKFQRRCCRSRRQTPDRSPSSVLQSRYGGSGAIQLDATRHHLYIRLMQAFRRPISQATMQSVQASIQL